MVNNSAVGAYDGGPDPLDRETVSRLNRQPFKLLRRQQFLIGLPDLHSGDVGALAVVTVIDDRSNRNSSRQLRQSAHVIIVKVGDQDVIDLADPRLPGDGNDSVGIPSVVSRPAGVD